MYKEFVEGCWNVRRIIDAEVGVPAKDEVIKNAQNNQHEGERQTLRRPKQKQ